ncbi:hypothetical protein [Micromonospora fluostatini]
MRPLVHGDHLGDADRMLMINASAASLTVMSLGISLIGQMQQN